jgi:hypothetical protein
MPNVTDMQPNHSKPRMDRKAIDGILPCSLSTAEYRALSHLHAEHYSKRRAISHQSISTHRMIWESLASKGLITRSGTGRNLAEITPLGIVQYEAKYWKTDAHLRR